MKYIQFWVDVPYYFSGWGMIYVTRIYIDRGVERVEYFGEGDKLLRTARIRKTKYHNRKYFLVGKHRIHLSELIRDESTFLVKTTQLHLEKMLDLRFMSDQKNAKID